MAGLPKVKVGKPGKAVEGDALATIFNSATKAARNAYNKVKSNAEIIQDRIAKFVPASEAKVERNIRAAAPEILSAERSQGSTFNPRTNRFVDIGEPGTMMATKPNPVDESNIISGNVEDLINYAKRPEVMSGLRRGDYMGSWSEAPGQLTLDPASRFKSAMDALSIGKKAEQRAGFDLKSGKTISLSDEEYIKSIADAEGLKGLGYTTAGIGVQAINKGRNYDEEGKPRSTANNLENLLSIALMARGGAKMFKSAKFEDQLLRPNTGLLSAPATFTKNTLSNLGDTFDESVMPFITGPNIVNKEGQTPTRSAMLPTGLLKRAEEAGVKLSQFTPEAGDVANTVINTVKSFNNPVLEDAIVKAIKPGDDQGTAFSKAYNILFNKFVRKYYAPLKEADKQVIIDRITETKPVVDPAMVDNIQFMVQDKLPDKSIKPRTSLPLTEDYTKVGKKALPYNIEDTGRLTGQDLNDQISGIIYNLEKEIDPVRVKFLQDNFGGESIFYATMLLKENANNGMTNTANLLGELVSALSSAATKPVAENTKALAVLALKPLKETLSQLQQLKLMTSTEFFSGVPKKQQAIDKKTGELVYDKKGKAVMEKTQALKDKEKEWRKGQAEEKFYKNIAKENSVTGELDKILYTLEQVINNPEMLYDLAALKGVQAKINTYLNNKSTLDESRAVTLDSWMARSASGNVEAEPIKDENTVMILNAVFENLAKKYGVTPKALQDIIWFDTRVVNKEGNEVPFLALGDKTINQPYTNNELEGPDAIELMKNNQAYKDRNLKFMEDFITTLEKNPEEAAKYKIYGSDLQYSPENVSKYTGDTMEQAALKSATTKANAAKVETWTTERDKLVKEEKALDELFRTRPDVNNVKEAQKIYEKLIQAGLKTDAHFGKILPEEIMNARGYGHNKLLRLKDYDRLAIDTINYTNKDKILLFNIMDKNYNIASAIEFINNLKTTMTPGQYETFAALQPDWTGSLDDLVNAAMTL